MKTVARIGMLLLLLAPGAARAQSGTVCGAWGGVSTPSPSAEHSVFAGVAASAANDVWAVGFYDTEPGYVSFLATLTAHWNGSAWTVIPSPNAGLSGSALTGVASVAGNDVWAVGYSSNFGSPNTLVLHWNGTAWAQVASPTGTGGWALDAVCAIAANDAWAVGTRSGALPTDQATVCTLIEHWNGSSWSVVPSPNVSNRFHDLVSVSAASANDVWAVGTSRNISELYRTLALHWNGSAWSVVPTPNLAGENELAAVVAIASDDVWAIGSANDGIAPVPLFLHWDGSSWTIVPAAGGPQACMGCMSGITAFASNDVWAVGSNFAHWDGTAWSLVPNPVVPDASSLAFGSVVRTGPCEAWAVGCGNIAGGIGTLAAHLTPGGGSVNLPPVAVAAGSPTSGPAPLTVEFSSSGSIDPDGSIVSYRWEFGDGSTSTSTEPNPTKTYVQTGPLTYHATLTVTDDQGATSTAAVEITVQPSMHAQSQVVDRALSGGNGGWIARDAVLIVDHSDLPLAGATVTARYSGPSGGIATGLTGSDGQALLTTLPAQDVTASWCFEILDVSKEGTAYLPAANASTTQCEGSGALDATAEAAPASRIRLTVAPNPVHGAALVQVRSWDLEPVNLRVYDANGRLVRELARALPGGSHFAVGWDGRSEDGRRVGSGIYFVRAKAGERIASCRVLLVR